MSYDYVIVGAGIAGCTCANKLAERGTVLLVEKRNSIGGLCADSFAGGYCQLLGPHIFHTGNQAVYDYLNQFGGFNDYMHKVRCKLADGREVPLPISIATLEALHGKGYTVESAKAYFDKVAVKIDNPSNAEEAVLCRFGEEIYHEIFKGYSEKQWGVSLSELPAHVTMRIPLRLNRNECYFSDQNQGIPSNGFTKMMEMMIDHDNIKVACGYDHVGLDGIHGKKATVWTGPINKYFHDRHGELNYRSLIFGAHMGLGRKQKSGCLNHCSPSESATRSSEYCLFIDKANKLGHRRVGIETPSPHGTPCYPLITDEENAKADKYREEAKKVDTYFVGRLAEYKYINIDQVVANALEITA